MLPSRNDNMTSGEVRKQPGMARCSGPDAMLNNLFQGDLGRYYRPSDIRPVSQQLNEAQEA